MKPTLLSFAIALLLIALFRQPRQIGRVVVHWVINIIATKIPIPFGSFLVLIFLVRYS